MEAGLLAGLGKGLSEGFNSYIENDRYEKERADRKKADALSKALQLRQLKDSGYDYNDQSGEITQSEKGLRDSEAATLKKQLDVFSEALKLLPEDQRLGTKQGKDLSDKVNSVTQRLSQLYSGDTTSIPQESPTSVVEAPKGLVRKNSSNAVSASPSGLVKTGSTIFGQPQELPADQVIAEKAVAKPVDDLPGLIKTSKGFLPGQLSKRDQEFNDALRKKAADIKIEESVGAPKQNQALAAGYAIRMADAEKAMQDLRDSGYDRTSQSQQRQAIFTDPGLDTLPWVGNAANGIVSGAARLSGLVDPKLYQQRQAEQNFVNALLRRESGSAISASEFQKAEEQYFPRYGDSPETLEQKAQNRLTAAAALRSEAGNAFDKALALRDAELSKRKKGLLKK